MTVNERIERLRQLMAERNIDIYIIPTADFHNTEFVGELGVPQISEYAKDKLPQGGTIAFDGRTMNTADYLKYKDIVTEKGGNLYTDEDLVDIIWEDRPSLSKEQAWLLTDEQAGEGRADKINRLREYMRYEGYDMILAAALGL